jgi:hypothetical protein
VLCRWKDRKSPDDVSDSTIDEARTMKQRALSVAIGVFTFAVIELEKWLRFHARGRPHSTGAN